MTVQTVNQNTDFVPGPPVAKFIGWKGNILKFMQDPIAYMQFLRREYGDIAGLVGRKPGGMTFVFGPEHNKQILSDAATYLNFGITQEGPPDSANWRMSQGLLSMNGEKHKKIRLAMTPPFHYRTVPRYHDDIVRLASDMLASWENRSELNVWSELNRFMKLVSINLLLGLKNEKKALEVAGLMEEWHAVNLSFPSKIWPYDLPGFPYRKMLRLAETLERELIDMINEKRQNLSDNDSLSILLKSNDENLGMTDQELAGQLNFLFAASFETTANATSWTMFLLSQHPEICERLVDEFEEVLGDRVPEYEELGKLVYCDRVIKEALRLFAPPVYAYRVCSKPVTLGPFEFPEKTALYFSHYITHHMEEIYPNANRFDPDRWLTIKPSNYEYLPFGASSHACLGATLAIAIMKTVLSMTLRRYRLTARPNSTVARRVYVTLAPKDGIEMLVTPQDRKFKESKTQVRGNVHEMVDLD